MEWEVIYKWLPKFIQGATLTLELVGIAVILGLLLAIPLGIARSSKLWYVRALPYAYIFFFRGTPLLVQLFLVYYGLAQFDAVRDSFMWPYLRDPFWCATATMTLHTAAYIAEILRGAIQAIPPGEIEAARALGMSRPKALFYIILPRAARIGLPAYSNEVILMLKASSLACTPRPTSPRSCVARSRPFRPVKSKPRGPWACPGPRRCSISSCRGRRASAYRPTATK